MSFATCDRARTFRCSGWVKRAAQTQGRANVLEPPPSCGEESSIPICGASSTTPWPPLPIRKAPHHIGTQCTSQVVRFSLQPLCRRVGLRRCSETLPDECWMPGTQKAYSPETRMAHHVIPQNASYVGSISIWLQLLNNFQLALHQSTATRVRVNLYDAIRTYRIGGY